ncbi:MAG TPA: FliA/WhiG family RNA polymerase sigma factor [Vicinamibacteria bacterium]|nr:FliA/WhiG family RNA polymerase sigma factor [Vicinamibacteria bacterium]
MDREALVRDSISLVERLAVAMAGHIAGQVELADLIQSGFVGLLDAASKFDRDKGARFSTYAEFRIKGAMLDSLRSLDWAPRSVRRVGRRVDTVERHLEASLGRPPREDEVAAGLGVGLAELRRTRERIRRAESAYQHNVPVEEFISTVSDPNAVDPHEMLEQLEAETLLARSIQDLPERERRVLSLYYYDGLTMRQVGAVLGVNESRISQIHSRVLSKLRRSLARGDAKPRLTPAA